MRILAPILIAALLFLPACKKLEPKIVEESQAQRDEGRDRRIRQACASQASYERLKVLAFEKAEELRVGSSPLLERLAAETVVRMEEPVVKSRDEALNVTVCEGTMVIDLPPGAEDAFNGERRLTAEVEYAAQAAADGSGLVYQLDGAEPIIYRLAAMDMKGGALPPPPAAVAAPVQTAENSAPPPVAEPAPRATARPAQKAPAPERPRATPQAQRTRTAAAAPPPGPVARPSFNCRNARTRTERMVCADEQLAARDRAMASLYYSAIANADRARRNILRDTRDRFLADRERCGTASCVAETYEDRVDEIDRIMSGQ